MKNLALVSFVGVDKQTKLDDLLEFNNSNLVYEFGVLYSDSKNDTYIRYPGHDFCSKFLNWAKDNKISRSLHLCGTSIDRYLVEDSYVLELCNNANRIQLNLNISKYPDHEKLADNILRVANKHNQCIILQKNGVKKKFNETFISRMTASVNISLSFLHDSSGGFGREIENVSQPEVEYFTGYAGGINPDNVIKIIKLVESNNSENIPYYIDMESGIRLNNVFSIEKCKSIKKSIENAL